MRDISEVAKSAIIWGSEDQYKDSLKLVTRIIAEHTAEVLDAVDCELEQEGAGFTGQARRHVLLGRKAVQRVRKRVQKP